MTTKDTTATTAVRALAAKLAEVMGEMRHVPKEGFNKAQNYRFVRETDVAEKASALLAERNVWVHQSVIESSREPLYQTQSGLTMWLTEVRMEFRFIDGETGEWTPPQMFVGHGADTGDKGVYKAMTGAEKYFLMKTFLVSTGDDPEADEKVDTAVAAKGASGGARIARGTGQVARGGKSDTATEAQVDEIARLTRRARLTASDLVPVISSTLGRAPADATGVRDFLKALTAAEAGKLVVALTDLAEFAETGTVTDTPVPGIEVV